MVPAAVVYFCSSHRASIRQTRRRWLVFHPQSTGAVDQLGIAVARARASDAYLDLLPARGNGIPGRAETSVELTYRYVINEHLTLQPDIQYVISSDYIEQRDNALVYGLRLQWRLFGAL